VVVVQLQMLLLLLLLLLLQHQQLVPLRARMLRVLRANVRRLMLRAWLHSHANDCAVRKRAGVLATSVRVVRDVRGTTRGGRRFERAHRGDSRILLL